MAIAFLPFLLAYLALDALASPLSPELLQREDLLPRNDTSSTLPINAIITDHNNVDITSSFEIMVYYEPKSSPNANLSARQAGTYATIINSCPYPEEEFMSSYCLVDASNPRGLQAYEVNCHLPQNYRNPETGMLTRVRKKKTRDSACAQNEICVDGLGPGKGSKSGKHVASCVGKQYYIRLATDLMEKMGGGQPDGAGGMSAMDLDGYKASFLLSKTDGTTPVEVDTFDAEAVDGAGNVQSKKCRDCMELQTDTLAPNTDLLMAQTTLLTTGVAAGILWVALTSG